MLPLDDAKPNGSHTLYGVPVAPASAKGIKRTCIAAPGLRLSMRLRAIALIRKTSAPGQDLIAAGAGSGVRSSAARFVPAAEIALRLRLVPPSSASSAANTRGP